MKRFFDRFAERSSSFAGHPVAFFASVALVALWLVTGPLFGFSDTWQLVINTATTVITFLMVFLVQATQNRNDLALHAKMDAVIAAIEKAPNEFMRLEEKDEETIRSHRDRLIEDES